MASQSLATGVRDVDNDTADQNEPQRTVKEPNVMHNLQEETTIMTFFHAF
jgi:hypothetical protein